MIVTNAVLEALRTNFKKDFQGALAPNDPQFLKIATKIKSNSSSNTYGWLGKFPRLREWIGDRQVNSLKEHGYQVINKKYEDTVGLDGDEIEDNELASLPILAKGLAEAVNEFPDELGFALLKQGETELCYDGQPFFDTEHPIYPKADGTGTPELYSNFDAGATANEPAWYLMDTTRTLKPMIFQERTTPRLDTIKDGYTNFMQDIFLSGIRYRCNAGFGFWQMAHKSQLDLTSKNVQAIISKMRAQKTDGGASIKISPNVILVPPALEWTARQIFDPVEIGGSTNIMKGMLEIIVVPELEA